MFKLLSPLVKDQTDQPSEPVSWFNHVMFPQCFILCVYNKLYKPSNNILYL